MWESEYCEECGEDLNEDGICIDCDQPLLTELRGHINMSMQEYLEYVSNWGDFDQEDYEYGTEFDYM